VAAFHFVNAKPSESARVAAGISTPEPYRKLYRTWKAKTIGPQFGRTQALPK